MARQAKRKVRVVDVAFSPSDRAICPHCFSLPSISAQREYILAGKRGFSGSMGDPVKVNRVLEHVVESKYPCSNADCMTHLMVRSVLRNLGSKEAYAPFLAKGRLKGKKADQYVQGTTGKDGIWRDEEGIPLIVAPTPVQREKPVPKKVKGKKVKATKRRKK